MKSKKGLGIGGRREKQDREGIAKLKRKVIKGSHYQQWQLRKRKSELCQVEKTFTIIIALIACFPISDAFLN